MGLLTGTVSLGLGIWGHATGRPWQTMIFTSLALLQLGNALAVRSERQSVFRLGLGSNRFLGWTVLGTLLVQLGLLYWPPAQTALDLQPLTLAELAIVLVASTTAFWAIEAEKLVSRLRASRRIPPGGRAAPLRPVEADQCAGETEGAPRSALALALRDHNDTFLVKSLQLAPANRTAPTLKTHWAQIHVARLFECCP
jgi:hypothetical protein